MNDYTPTLADRLRPAITIEVLKLFAPEKGSVERRERAPQNAEDIEFSCTYANEWHSHEVARCIQEQLSSFGISCDRSEHILRFSPEQMEHLNEGVRLIVEQAISSTGAFNDRNEQTIQEHLSTAVGDVAGGKRTWMENSRLNLLSGGKNKDNDVPPTR